MASNEKRAAANKPWPAAGIALLGVLYFLVARLSLEPRFLEGDLGRIVWPASGVALAALLVYGIRLWPGVALGAFVTTWSTSDPMSHAVATSVGNTLEVVLAVFLLRRVGFDAALERARDVLALVICAAFVGASVSALFGVLGLYVSGLAGSGALVPIAWKWCLGHAMGVIAVTPFLITVPGWLRRARGPAALLEPALVLLPLVLIGGIAFIGTSQAGYHLEYLPFPILIWAAYRGGPPGAAGVNLVSSAIAVIGATAGSGPFEARSPEETLIMTWSFVNVTAVTTLLLASVLVEGRRAQQERRRSEIQYRTVIDQAAEGIVIADASGRLRDVNRCATEMLGYDREPLLTRQLPDLVAREGREEARGDVNALAPGHANMLSWLMERSDGSRFFAEVSIKRFDDGQLHAFIRDVSERLELEAQLHHSQRLEAVGILAGGIAHDFNNLLTAIIGHADFARMHLPKDHRIRADIEEVVKAAARAAELTRQLLAFARKQIVEPKVIVLGELLAELQTMLERVLGERIELVMRGTPDPWPVKVDPGQLEQVILNIAINAKDAMPEGGRLEVVCGNVTWRESDDDAEIRMAPGDYAMVSLTDSGKGMDRETLSRVFEPFYTTKDRSHGTGLGLAVSYGIVKQAGGYIWASSEGGRGTTFRIFLPRADDADRSEPRVAPLRLAEPEIAAGGETILLIEDEPLVRDLVVEVLETRNYRVLAASDAEEALDLARAHPSEIHLTVTDVVLPAMSGKEVAKRLKRDRPELKVLFMSGYAEEQIVHRGVVERDVAFLSKPFTPTTLSQKVRAVLDHGS